MMTAIDLSTMADKLAQPGVVKVVVFDLFVSVSLFTITCSPGPQPWPAARTRSGANARVVIAIVVSGLLSRPSWSRP